MQRETPLWSSERWLAAILLAFQQMCLFILTERETRALDAGWTATALAATRAAIVRTARNAGKSPATTGPEIYTFACPATSLTQPNPLTWRPRSLMPVPPIVLSLRWPH